MECKYTHFEFQYDWIEHKNGKRVDKRAKFCSYQHNFYPINRLSKFNYITSFPWSNKQQIFKSKVK